MKERDEELAKAKRVMRNLGFVPISWELEVDGQRIWIEEAYRSSPHFEVSGPYTMAPVRSTAADLKKTVVMMINEERLASRAPDRGMPREKKKG